MIEYPTVTLLAFTTVTPDLTDILPPDDPERMVFDSDLLAEFAGRACYQSFARPNPKTATTRDYIRHIIDVEHFSVMSHASASFYIEGVSRTLTHELVRHRFLAFSQVSQRYVDSSQFDWVCPPLALDNAVARARLQSNFNEAVLDYNVLVEWFMENEAGAFPDRVLLRKRAREAARSALPNCTETKIVVSGNLRAWRDFLQQRLAEGADLEIRRLANVLLGELRDLAPSTFADMTP